MSFDQTDYPSAANLIGKTDVPRNVNPMVRSSTRRNDPDGGSSVPYYPNISGKFLRIGYTNEVSTVVTAQQIDIALATNSLAGIISTINAAASSTDVEALDLDGFLAVRNLNPGKTHYIQIMPYSTSLPDDAAPALGFEVTPFPGSKSYAGEIAAAPGSRLQSNPQTTALMARDNGLSAREINRPLAASLRLIEDLRSAMSRDVIVYKDVTMNFVGAGIATIGDDTLRVYSIPVTSPTAADFEPFFKVLKTDHSQAINEGVSYNSVQVTNMFYGPGQDTSGVFVAWGTPDGKKATGTAVLNKDKQAATAITSIKGNIVYCAGADFVTKKVKTGDPVELVATNLQPFDHSGWWAVDAVIDATHLALRPMADSISEPAPAAGNKPRELNPTAGGTLRVAVGRFIPAGDIQLQINDASVTNMIVRLPIGVPLKDATAEMLGAGGLGSLTQLGNLLNAHVADTTSAHAATAIGGFVSSVPWQNATFSGDIASIRATIEDIIADLSSNNVGENTQMLGASAVSIVGLPPNSLSAGNIKGQLTTLLTLIRDHVTDSGAHAGAGATYSGSPNWANGTFIPSGVTIDSAIDQVVSDLASLTSGNSGAHKIGVNTLIGWLSSGGSSGSNLQALLNSIITDLSAQGATDGASRIGTNATADLSLGSVRFNLDQLATGWGKLNRANTWSASQTMNGTASDTAAALFTNYNPTNRKLLWAAALPAGAGTARVYAGKNDVDVGWEFTVNANWNGTNWVKDQNNQHSSRFVMIDSGFYLQTRVVADGNAAWADTLGAWHNPIFLTAETFSGSTPVPYPSMTASNNIRAHGKFSYNGLTGVFTQINAFNCTIAADTASFPGRVVFPVTFAAPMPHANYVTLSQCQGTYTTGAKAGFFQEVGMGGAQTINDMVLIVYNGTTDGQALATGGDGATVSFVVIC